MFPSTDGALFESPTLTGFIRPLPVTPETLAETQPLRSHQTMLLYQGHVDNRGHLAQALDNQSLAGAPDGAVLLAAAEKWGHRLQQHVAGDYSFIAVNKRDSTVIAGRDPLGVKRVYYHATDDRLTVSSSLRLLLAGLDATPSLDPEGVAEFIRCGELAAMRTIYRQVHIVPPGHSLVWRNGSAQVVDAWMPNFGAELSAEPVAELEQECRSLLNAAVTAALRCRDRVCVELSGGLDSSTVTCIAANVWSTQARSGAPPIALSLTRGDDRDSAEAAYRREALNACRLPNQTIDVNPFVTFSPFIGEIPCEPLFHLADPAKYRPVRDLQIDLGLQTCLTGCGGDEVFAGNLDQPYFLRDWLRQLRLRRWWEGVQSYIRAGRSNLRRLCNLSITTGFASTGLDRPHWLTVGDKHVAHEHYYARLVPKNATRRYQSQAMQLALIRCAAIGQSRPYSWDERHPLLFRPLVEFMLRVPWSLKANSQSTRGLHRQTTVGILPEKLRIRETKGPSDSNILRDFSRSWATVKPLAEARSLGDYSFVDARRFFDACHRMSHGLVSRKESYLDLWNALVLERWLQLDGPRQGDLARSEYRRLRTSALSIK